jgi:hypothetical protein
MAGLIAALVGILVLALLARLLVPGLFAALMVLVAPLWLLGGLLRDLLRALTAWRRSPPAEVEQPPPPALPPASRRKADVLDLVAFRQRHGTPGGEGPKCQ